MKRGRTLQRYTAVSHRRASHPNIVDFDLYAGETYGRIVFKVLSELNFARQVLALNVSLWLFLVCFKAFVVEEWILLLCLLASKYRLKCLFFLFGSVPFFVFPFPDRHYVSSLYNVFNHNGVCYSTTVLHILSEKIHLTIKVLIIFKTKLSFILDQLAKQLTHLACTLEQKF